MANLIRMRVFLFLVLCFALRAPQFVWAQSQVPVLVSLPDTTAAPGETIEVPVLVSDVTGLEITSSDLSIQYDGRIVTAGRVFIAGTLTNRWLEAHRAGFLEGSADTTGIINIAVATADRIPSGAGVLLVVEFTVSATARNGQTTALTLTEAILNTRNPSTTTKNGSITVEGGATLVGDFNGDCVVNFQDFILLARHFGQSEGDPGFDPIFDLNGDGRVNFPDFVMFAQSFGETCGTEGG